MKGGRIDKRHLAHAHYAHLGLAAEGGAHHFVEFGCNAEEERAVDFVDAYPGEHVEHFVM